MALTITGKRVLLYGDSQMQGLAPKLEELLRTAGAADVVTVVQSGLPLRGALERLPPPHGFDLTFVSLGGNNPPRTTTEARNALSRVAFALGPAPIVWVTVLPSSDPELEVGRSFMRQIQRTYLPQKGVITVSGPTLVAGLRYRDHVHLEPRSYQDAAERLLSSVITTRLPLVGTVLVGVIAGAAFAAWCRRHRV